MGQGAIPKERSGMSIPPVRGRNLETSGDLRTSLTPLVGRTLVGKVIEREGNIERHEKGE